jgi:hypothetical protein
MDATLKKFSELKNWLVNEVLGLINQDRQLQNFDTTRIHLVIDLFTSLNLYQTDFHCPLVESTKNFYGQIWSGQKIENGDSLEKYLTAVWGILEKEESRVLKYLNEVSLGELITEIEKILVVNRKQEILCEKFDQILDSKSYPAVKKIFGLFLRHNESDFFNKYILYYIRKTGLAILERDDPKVVGNVLEIHTNMLFLIENCFDCDPKIKIVFSAGFEQFINQKPNKAAEIWVKYFDALLRDRTSENTVEAKAKDAHSVFKYIQAKDVFRLSYNQRLIRRLFMNEFVSLKNEKSV